MNRFEIFIAHLVPDDGATGPAREWTEHDTERLVGARLSTFTSFMSNTVRSSFNSGLLRFLLPSGTEPLTLNGWNSDAGWMSSWPHRRRQFRVFAYDWLGRQIGFVLRRDASEPGIGMLDPGTGDLLELPSSFEDVFCRELPTDLDGYLSASMYATWLGSGGRSPALDQCVGYRQPLFLNGADEVQNLELTDMSVYISLSGQLAMATVDAPVGTRVGGVTIK